MGILEKVKFVIETSRKIFSDRVPQISDGYHTFDDLYKHRSLLFLSLLRSLQDKYTAWKSLRHHDGSYFQGYFLVCVEIEGEQISYHLESKYWEMTSFIESFDVAPVKFDGHTSDDVLERLTKFINHELL